MAHYTNIVYIEPSEFGKKHKVFFLGQLTFYGTHFDSTEIMPQGGARKRSISKSEGKALKKASETIINILQKADNDGSITPQDVTYLQSVANIVIEKVFVFSGGTISIQYVDQEALKEAFKDALRQGSVEVNSTSGDEEEDDNEDENLEAILLKQKREEEELLKQKQEEEFRKKLRGRVFESETNQLENIYHQIKILKDHPGTLVDVFKFGAEINISYTALSGITTVDDLNNVEEALNASKKLADLFKTLLRFLYPTLYPMTKDGKMNATCRRWKRGVEHLGGIFIIAFYDTPMHAEMTNPNLQLLAKWYKDNRNSLRISKIEDAWEDFITAIKMGKPQDEMEKIVKRLCYPEVVEQEDNSVVAGDG